MQTMLMRVKARNAKTHKLTRPARVDKPKKKKKIIVRRKKKTASSAPEVQEGDSNVDAADSPGVTAGMEEWNSWR